MAKIKWDYENTTIRQRLGAIFSIAIMVVILGFLIFVAITKLLPPYMAIFFLSIMVAAELVAESWNKWSPWAPSEDND